MTDTIQVLIPHLKSGLGVQHPVGRWLVNIGCATVLAMFVHRISHHTTLAPQLTYPPISHITDQSSRSSIVSCAPPHLSISLVVVSELSFLSLSLLLFYVRSIKEVHK